MNSDMEITAEEMGRIKREHWSVEDRLHHVLDNAFREKEVASIMMALFNQEKAVEQFGYERMQEGRKEGIIELLGKQVKSGDMSVEKAAQYAGMSLEQFLSH